MRIFEREKAEIQCREVKSNKPISVALLFDKNDDRRAPFQDRSLGFSTCTLPRKNLIPKKMAKKSLN